MLCLDPDVDENLKLVRLCLNLACTRDDVHTLDILVPKDIMCLSYYTFCSRISILMTSITVQKKQTAKTLGVIDALCHISITHHSM